MLLKFLNTPKPSTRVDIDVDTGQIIYFPDDATFEKHFGVWPWAGAALPPRGLTELRNGESVTLVYWMIGKVLGLAASLLVLLFGLSFVCTVLFELFAAGIPDLGSIYGAIWLVASHFVAAYLIVCVLVSRVTFRFDGGRVVAQPLHLYQVGPAQVVSLCEIARSVITRERVRRRKGTWRWLLSTISRGGEEHCLLISANTVLIQYLAARLVEARRQNVELQRAT
jgi:hypothetical protein